MLINNLPTLDDKLGWNAELNRLKEHIQDCNTPHVPGIHGDVGSGKTSFMLQLKARLGGDCRLRVQCRPNTIFGNDHPYEYNIIAVG